MKKLLVALLVFTVIGVCGADRIYAYKMTNGKAAPLHVITSEQAQEYIAKGFTIETSKKAIWKLIQSTGQERSFLAKESVSAYEKFTWLNEFSKLAVGRALRAIRNSAELYSADMSTWEDNLLAFFATTPEAKRDWDNATVINLEDPAVKQFLPQLGIDVEALKQKMWQQGAR